MLLPWARRGTLGDLWNKTDPKDATLQWFSQQVVALVGVANLLYKLDCRHGDYKPENILVFDEFEPTAQPISEEVAGGLRLCRFEDGDERVLKEKSLGDLVAADFDSAKVNETATKDRDITHGYLSDRRYEPPERHPDHPDHDKAGSRRCDVWCLGCVFLEFVIWKCWGKSGVDAFNDDLGNKSRGGFWVREDGFKVHTAVQKWSSKIRGLQDDRSQERLDGLTSVEQAYILRLLDVIMTEMLIVRIRTDAKGEGTCRSDLPGIYQNIMENDLGGDWTELINMITPNTMEGDIE